MKPYILYPIMFALYTASIAILSQKVSFVFLLWYIITTLFSGFIYFDQKEKYKLEEKKRLEDSEK